MANKVFTGRKMRLLLPGGFAVQEDHETPLASSAFTVRQPITNPAWHSNIAFRKAFRDCANAYILKEIVTGKIARFSIAFEAPAAIAAGWYYWLLGGGSVAASTRTTEDRPVLFGLIEGIEGEDQVGRQYDNIAMNTWSVQINKRRDCLFTIEAFGKATPTEVAVDWPECSNEDPVAAKDCSLSLDGFADLDDLLSINYTESNNLDTSEEAFDAWSGTDITDWQLGDHTAQLNAQFLGTPDAALYAAAEDEDNAFGAMSLVIGPVGDRLTIAAPNMQYRLDDSLIAFVGNKNRTAFSIIGRPSPNNLGVVTTGTYAG
jgi:hypothetical protein